MCFCAKKKLTHGKLVQLGMSHRIINNKIVSLNQLDFDIIGHGDRDVMVSEAECFRLMSEVFGDMSLDAVKLRVNHCGILISLINLQDKSDDVRERVWTIVDRYISPSSRYMSDQFVADLVKVDVDERSAQNILKYLELESSPHIIDQLAEDPDFADANESIMELRNLLKYCKAFKVSYEVCLEPKFAKKFVYYTGLIFEAVYDEKVLACGGRYDRLASQIQDGFQIPCVGFTFSVEVLKQLYVPWSIEEGGLPCPQRIVTPSLPVPGGILCDLCVSRDSHVLRMQDVDRILLLSNDANMETLQHVNPSALVFGNVHFIPERCYRIDVWRIRWRIVALPMSRI
jgi:hypothetical protein